MVPRRRCLETEQNNFPDAFFLSFFLWSFSLSVYINETLGFELLSLSSVRSTESVPSLLCVGIKKKALGAEKQADVSRS